MRSNQFRENDEHGDEDMNLARVGLIGVVLVFLAHTMDAHADPARARALLDEARATQDLQARIGLLERALALDSLVEACLLKAETHQRLVDHVAALRTLDECDPRSDMSLALVFAMQARSYGETGKLFEAVSAMRAALDKHPDPVPSWMPASLRHYDALAAQQIASADQILSAFENAKSAGLTIEIDLRVPFDYDKASLNERGAKQVEQLGLALKRAASIAPAFSLIGHTDRHGSDEYNIDLSRRRAETVRLQVSTEVPELVSRLCIEARGKQELMYRDETAEADALNRRVEVKAVDSCHGT